MLKIATVCSGIGSPEQAVKELNIDHEIIFGCEIDKYAKKTYQANFKPKYMLSDMTAEDWSNPKLYADLFIGGIPCQAFSLAGKRMGELDPRGLLFYNYYDYVKKQKPKYFIIENVKGLLSDAGGKTFQTWMDLLGQSVNTEYNMFTHEDSLLYNLHYTILNSKDFGVPQTRERVFLVGIRNDLPNDFRFPVGIPLTIRLKDILEPVVDEKYYLTDTAIKSLIENENTIEPFCVAMRGRDSDDPNKNTEQRIEPNSTGTTNTITSVQKDNLIVEPKIIQHIIPEMVSVRKYEVDIPGLQECLATHRNCKTIKTISTALNVTKTMAEHWFRTDKYFSIPDAQYWLPLRELLKIRTDKFDKSIMEFEEKENVFEKSNRVYDENGLAPTLTSTSADERILTYSQEDPKIIGYTRDEHGAVIKRHLKDEAGTIHGSSGHGGNTDQFVLEPKLILQHTLTGGKWDKMNESIRRVYSSEGIAPTVTAVGGGAS